MTWAKSHCPQSISPSRRRAPAGAVRSAAGTPRCAHARTASKAASWPRKKAQGERPDSSSSTSAASRSAPGTIGEAAPVRRDAAASAAERSAVSTVGRRSAPRHAGRRGGTARAAPGGSGQRGRSRRAPGRISPANAMSSVLLSAPRSPERRCLLCRRPAGNAVRPSAHPGRRGQAPCFAACQPFV